MMNIIREQDGDGGSMRVTSAPRLVVRSSTGRVKPPA